jgi:hypothetical protein
LAWIFARQASTGERDRKHELLDLLLLPSDSRGFTCTGCGAGKPYPTETDCKTDFQSKAASVGPDSQCGRRMIDNTRYEACVESAEYRLRCGPVDAIVVLADCNSTKVCTDPPR